MKLICQLKTPIEEDLGRNAWRLGEVLTSESLLLFVISVLNSVGGLMRQYDADFDWLLRQAL